MNYPLFRSSALPNDFFSGSMEPAFYRGDLLFLTNPTYERYRTGDITVYKVPGAEIPIVHRVMETHDYPSKSKSDNAEAGYVQYSISQVKVLTDVWP